MFGSAILDVAIGMSVVYLLLSLIASGVQEGISVVLQARSASLLLGLHSLFSGDKGPDGNLLLNAVYDHGLIRGLYRDPKKDSNNPKLRMWDRLRMKLQDMLGLAPPTGLDKISNRLLLPAYIPSNAFALALTDILDPAESGQKTSMDALRSRLAAAVKTDATNKAMQALSALADSAGDDVGEFERRVAKWYDDAMDRVSGWYKKYTQNILLAIGLILAVAFNVNSIRVANALWTDKDAREAMVTMAKQYTNDGNPVNSQGAQGKTLPDLGVELTKRIQTMQEVSDQKLLPIGWNGPLWGDAKRWEGKSLRVLLALVGWCITALALSLGASFWFDTLNRFMVIRGTIKPDEKSQPEASKG